MSVILTKRNSAGVRGYQNKCAGFFAKFLGPSLPPIIEPKDEVGAAIVRHLMDVNAPFYQRSFFSSKRKISSDNSISVRSMVNQ